MTRELKSSQLQTWSADVLQNSEKLWTIKKFYLTKHFLYHILSTSPRFIFHSVHPTASQSVISLKIPLIHWSRKQLVENLCIISDKHTQIIIWYSFYKTISLTLWTFYYCRKREIKENWNFQKIFDTSLKRWNCDLLQDYKIHEQLSHLTEDFAEL